MDSLGFSSRKAKRRFANPITQPGIADLGANHTGQDISNFVFGPFSFQQFRFARWHVLTPPVLDPKVLQGVDPDITNDAVHILKIDIVRLELLFKQVIGRGTGPGETIYRFYKHYLNLVFGVNSKIYHMLHRLDIARRRLKVAEGLDDF